MSMLKNFATVGGATMLSRVLGFARDVMIAAFIGAGPVADAFFVAFRLPNLFRRLFAEGAFNSAFIPLFARAVEEGGDKEGARRFAGEILAALFWALLLVCAFAEIAMPVLVWALAPGFGDDPSKFDLTVLMSRIAFPYLMCLSLVAFLSGILNTFRHFAAAAFAPVMLNVVMIAVLLTIGWLAPEDERSIGLLLSVGVAIAGFVQLALLIIAVRRMGFSIPLKRPRFTPNVKRLLRLGIPGVVAGGITQINIVVGTIIASTQASAVAYLYYADRVYQLPLGVVGIAIGVVLLPDLSRQFRAGRDDLVQHSQNRAMEFALALTLPAAIALLAIPLPIVTVLFQRGAFDAAAADATAAALAAYAIGLPAFVLNKVLSPGFFAREDTRTPMWFAGAGMLVNVAGALALAPFLHHVGIALAASAAGWINTGLLGFVLWRRGHFIADAALKRRLPLLALASVLMGVALYFGSGLMTPYLLSPTLPTKVTALGALIGGGVALFALFVQLTGAVNLLAYARKLRRKTPPAP